MAGGAAASVEEASASHSGAGEDHGAMSRLSASPQWSPLYISEERVTALRVR